MEKKLKELRRSLLEWYYKNKRDLPWRKTQDPFSIWLSEIMLQQTTVKTVIPYYEKFLKKYPDFKSIAKAKESDLLKAWAGLGYYNRIRNFQKAARHIAKNLKNKVPQKKEELITLPGLGSYTSAAIASIAFNEAVGVVDGNVKRVLSRLFTYEKEIKTSKADKYFQEKVDYLLDKKNPGDFNQAMMELGACICTPKNPLCLLCPLQKYCLAFKKGVVLNYPLQTKKIKYKDQYLLAVVFKSQDYFFIRKRDEKEIMASMWEIPFFEISGKESWDSETIKAFLKKENFPHLGDLEEISKLRHSIMNLRIKIRSFQLKLKKKYKMPLQGKWIPISDLSTYPLTTMTRKILEKNN